MGKQETLIDAALYYKAKYIILLSIFLFQHYFCIFNNCKICNKKASLSALSIWHKQLEISFSAAIRDISALIGCFELEHSMVLQLN